MKRVVVLGEKRLAQECLAHLHESPLAEVVGIFTSASDWQADLRAWGREHDVPVYTDNVNPRVDVVRDLAPDLIVSLQYRPLVKRPVLELPPQGCVNMHFGLLPRYGGCHPIAWAILNGEAEAGATLHVMTEAFDEGDVLAQTRVPITPVTTARDLFDDVTDAAVHLFAERLPDLLAGRLEARPQNLADKLYYAKDSIDFARDSVVVWDAPADAVQRRICAFTFPPFQLPSTDVTLPDGTRRRVTVTRTRTLDSYSGEPGQIVATRGSAIVVGTRQGALEVRQLDAMPAVALFDKLGAEPTEARLG